MPEFVPSGDLSIREALNRLGPASPEPI